MLQLLNDESTHGAQTMDPNLIQLTPEEWHRVVAIMGLTPREADVVRMVLQAKADKEIALALGMGDSTIRSHLRHIFAKNSLAGRMELILRVFAIVRQSTNH